MDADCSRDNPGRLVAYWLLPSAEDNERLAAAIARLSRQLNAPLFAPHLSLYSTVLDRSESPEGLLRKLSQRQSPVAGEVGRTQHSSELFRALFLPVSGSEFHDLYQAIHSACRRKATDFQFDPHISLLYKQLPRQEREALANAESMAGERFTFDRVAAVFPAAGAHDFSDIAGWRQVAVQSLTGGGS